MLTEQDIAAIVEHMNADHADALLLYAQAFGGVPEAEHARMLGIEPGSLELEITGPHGRRRVRVTLPEQIAAPGDARRVLVAMVGEARRRLGGSEET